jgi:hypothetical protein
MRNNPNQKSNPFQSLKCGVPFLGHRTHTKREKRNNGLQKIKTFLALSRSLRMSRDQLLTKETLAKGAITYKGQANLENHTLSVISSYQFSK